MSPAAPTATTRQLARWERFRAGRHAALSEEFGWLTLTSLQWLGPDPARLEYLPGRWSASARADEGGTAFLEATAADGLVLAASGRTVEGRISASLANEESLEWVRCGNILAELIVRGERYAVRTRDLDSAVYRGFSGVPVFAYDPRFVVTGRFHPYDAGRTVGIGTSHPEEESVATAVGEVEFELEGRTHRLVAEPAPLGGLTINFHDRTNGSSTYGWRKVATPKPRPDGTVAIDFNRAINYPSAFTAYGTCPRPIAGNAVDAAVEAGEKLPIPPLPGAPGAQSAPGSGHGPTPTN